MGYPRISMGRGDVAALARTFFGTLKADRKEVRQRELSGNPDKPAAVVPTSVVVVTYPIGWNADGQPVLWEAQTVTEVMGKMLHARAKSERRLPYELQFQIAQMLMQSEQMPSDQARAKGRTVAVYVADRLPRRPSAGQILGADGEALEGGSHVEQEE